MRLFRAKQRPLKSINVWFTCPACDGLVRHCLNDTEVLSNGDLLTPCPNCERGIRLHFVTEWGLGGENFTEFKHGR